MRTFSDLIQSIMAGRGGSQALGEALAARERAITALENPNTLEERRTLVFTLLDYSNMFNGQIEGREADARHKLRARQRAFDVAAQLPADDPMRAEASIRLGIASLDVNAERAAELIRDGLAMLDNGEGANKAWVINARENLGNALLRLERWSECVSVLDAARRAWVAGVPDAPPGQPGGALSFNLGFALQHLGRWQEARDAFREAIACHVRDFGADHPNTIEAELHYGVALVELGLRDEARPLLERVATVVREKAGESHRYYKLAIDSLARI